LLVIAIIFAGYRQPIASVSNVNTENLNLSDDFRKVSVDDVLASGVASVLANATSLPVAPDVSNLAISTGTQFQFEQSNSVTSAKPQIVGTIVPNRSIFKYTVKEGDSIDSIAANFKISVNTIKWANNLTYNGLSVGKELRILPIDGTAYTVKPTDSIDSIAEKYKVDKTRLVIYNDLDVSGLIVGNEIILPNSTLPEKERPGYVAPVVYYAGQGTGLGGSTWFISYGSAGPCPPYVFGQCTCYTYARRAALRLPVPASVSGGTWGNAVSWAQSARNTPGFVVNSTPAPGAIIQNGGGLGHVAIVEEVKPNGDLSVSEMNAYVFGGGWNIVSGRIVPAGNVSSYLYIH